MITVNTSLLQGEDMVSITMLSTISSDLGSNESPKLVS